MRREGRIHGAYVRERKHSWPPGKAPSKPTSHSRYTAKTGEFTLPVNKARDKGKGTLKEREFSMNCNYKMHDWRISGTCPSSKKPYLNVESPYSVWDHRNLDGDDIDHEETPQFSRGIPSETAFWTSQIVLPIESVLRLAKRRKAKAQPVSEALDASAEDTAGESDDSWSGIDFNDGEDDVSDECWADDWSLVEEAV